MADPTTVNTSLAIPIRGTDVGTWDLPVNGNFNSIDAMIGGVTTVALSTTSVTLATSQALVNVIRVTGTLLSNVSITLPGIYKSWTVDNQIVNSPSSFAVTLISTSGASIIGLPPGPQDVFYDGSNVNYRNLGRIGEYWDYAGTTVPSWVTLSSKPPYLNCDGTAFSSATYPILANLLGTTTKPDSRGRFRAALNQTSSRILSSRGGVDGNTAYVGGGLDSITLGTSQIPAHSHGVTDPGHTHTSDGVSTLGAATAASPGSIVVPQTFSALNINAAVTGISIQNTGGGGAHSNMSPTYIGGITMIRAA